MVIAPCEIICGMSARHTITAPFSGVVVSISFAGAESVGAGTPVMVLEAMKMEHEVLAESAGIVSDVAVAVGDAVEQGQLLMTLEPADGNEAANEPALQERSVG